jgi:cytochrome c-type biogenesis protein
MAAVTNTLAFALGFMAVFVILGASLGALSHSLSQFGAWLNRISGLFMIGLGLVTLGLVKVPLMERGFGLRFAPGTNLRYLGSVLVGATFAVGWTPCVGPILGGVLVLAGTSGSVGQGALLLTSYSLGLMVPFVAAGVMTGWTSWMLRRHGKWLSYANYVAGILLIALGIGLFTGLLPLLSSYLALGT